MARDLPVLFTTSEAAAALGVHEQTVVRWVKSGRMRAAKHVAIDRLAKFICEIGPAPTDRPGVTVEAGGSTQEVSCDPCGQPLAYVFKTIADPYVGKVSLFKVLS